MANRPMPEETREVREKNPTQGKLIAAANKNDRFKLLEDDSVPASNLTIDIHPIFAWFDCNGPMEQMLRLASHLIAHDSVLTFFVPLLHGRTLISTDNGKYKSFLSDPFITASETKRKRLLESVRQALRDLAQTCEFSYGKPEGKIYARTLLGRHLPYDTPIYCSEFQRKRGVRIEIADRIQKFYQDKNGYRASSRCSQFRQDFHFAVTIVHEIIHAVGVQRRGDLDEPFIRADYFETEWGFAWENFMFGSIMNPQPGNAPAVDPLTRKTWAKSSVAEGAGGKQYSDVPMSYVAQWFREKTWDVIAEKGPTGIPLPVAHFTVQQCRRFGSWRLATYSSEAKRDVENFYKTWAYPPSRIDERGNLVSRRPMLHVELTSIEELQRQNVKSMLRVPRSHRSNYVSYIEGSSVSKSPIVPNSLGASRKRPAESEVTIVRATKIVKVEQNAGHNVERCNAM